MHRLLALTVAFCAAVSVAASAGQTLTPRPAPAGARTAPVRVVDAPRAIDPRILPGTPDSVFSTVQGHAIDSTGVSMPEAAIRLRDARSGRIVGTLLSDDAGMFTFRGIDPGTYIVEILGSDSTVLAASQMLSVNAGDALSAVVKLPFRIPPFAGFFGHTATSAAVVAGAAASAQVLAAAATQKISPE